MNVVIANSFFDELEKIASFATLAFGGVKGVTSKPARSIVKTVINPAVGERTRVGVRSGFKASPITKGTTAPPVHERTVRKIERPAVVIEGTPAMKKREGPYRPPDPQPIATRSRRRGDPLTEVSQTGRKPGFFRGILGRRKAAAETKAGKKPGFFRGFLKRRKEAAEAKAAAESKRNYEAVRAMAQRSAPKSERLLEEWTAKAHKGLDPKYLAQLRQRWPEIYKASSAFIDELEKIAGETADKITRGALATGLAAHLGSTGLELENLIRDVAHHRGRKKGTYIPKPRYRYALPLAVGGSLLVIPAFMSAMLRSKKRDSTKTAAMGPSIGTKQEGVLPTFADVKPITPFVPKPVSEQPTFRPGPSPLVKMPGARPFGGPARGPRAVTMGSGSGAASAAARLQVKYPTGSFAKQDLHHRMVNRQLAAQPGAVPGAGLPNKPPPSQWRTGSRGAMHIGPRLPTSPTPQPRRARVSVSAPAASRHFTQQARTAHGIPMGSPGRGGRNPYSLSGPPSRRMQKPGLATKSGLSPRKANRYARRASRLDKRLKKLQGG